MRKSLNICSSIACNTTIASNKQKQEPTNLTLVCRAQLKEAHEHLKSLVDKKKNKFKTRTQMQTLTRMDRVVIKNYYHITTMDENVCWMKLTHLL